MQIKPTESATIAAPTSDRILSYRITRVPESSRYPLPFDSLNLKFSRATNTLLLDKMLVCGSKESFQIPDTNRWGKFYWPQYVEANREDTDSQQSGL